MCSTGERMNFLHKLPGLHQPRTSSRGLWPGHCGVLVMFVAILSAASTVYGQATYHVLAAFDLPGTYPYAGLIQASDGNFYGTTSGGGASSRGTVFKMDAAETLTQLYSLRSYGSDGTYPYGGLIQASDGTFYGTTSQGGVSGYGTVFKIDAAGTLMRLHSFTGNDGAGPFAALIQATDGTFYGTTPGGGASNRGTVFKIDAAGTLTTLHSFNQSDGANSYA